MFGGLYGARSPIAWLFDAIPLRCALTSRIMSPETLAILSAIASAATALGALAAAWQLYLVHKQSVTNFEDSFAKDTETLWPLCDKGVCWVNSADEEYLSILIRGCTTTSTSATNRLSYIKLGASCEKNVASGEMELRRTCGGRPLSARGAKLRHVRIGVFSELRALSPPKAIARQIP